MSRPDRSRPGAGCAPALCRAHRRVQPRPWFLRSRQRARGACAKASGGVPRGDSAHMSSAGYGCCQAPQPHLALVAPQVERGGARVSDELLMVRAAELYYEDGKTQDEIGALLRTTRWKVGRLLAKARDRGIVRIEIVHPRARRLSLERLLQERYGLSDAIVVPAADDADVQASVARAAADYLAALRPIPRVLGISWGRTLSAVADRVAPGWANEVRVVQINGGISLSSAPG